MSTSSSTAIGVHLGSSFACVGVWKNGAVEIVADDLGDRTTAAVVSFAGEGLDTATVGRAASTRPHADSFKARMGEAGAKLSAGGRDATPVELSAAVLRKLRATAAGYLGADVTDAVICVPAGFSPAARAATREAAEAAGLRVVRVLAEPVAAAIAYGLDEPAGAAEADGVDGKAAGVEELVLVMRVGASTSDATVLRRADGLFCVQGHASSPLGGNTFDAALVKHLAADFARKNKQAGDLDERALARLAFAAEKAKRTLSSSARASVQVDSLADGVDFFADVTRARFEMLCAEGLRGVADPVDAALAEAGATRADVGRVLLVGGATKTPKVRSAVTALFVGTQAQVLSDVNADEAVAHGAATEAHLLARGPQCADPQAGGEGAGGALPVTALTLGVRASHGVLAPVIPRGTAVPCRRTRVFTSSSDQQEAVGIEVVEGEAALAADARVLGRLSAPLRKAARGKSQVKVVFELDAQGVLTVSARGVQLRLDGKHPGEEAVRAELAKADASAAANAAARRKAKVGAALESLTYALKNATHLERINEEDRATLRKAVDESGRWLEANPDAATEELQKHLDSLVEDVAPLLKSLYGADGGKPAVASAVADAAEESEEEESEEEESDDESEEDEDSDLD